MVHQFENPSYVVSGSNSGKMIHVSYHDGQHYNSVHPTSAAAAGLGRPRAPHATHVEHSSSVKPSNVYARAVSALGIQGAPKVPSARTLAMVSSVLEDMGGDDDAAHEFLLVDPNFAAMCAAGLEPELEPEPEPESNCETLVAPREKVQSWTLAEQETFELGLASFGKDL